MDHTPPEGLLTIDQIRALVDRWSEQGFLRVRGLGTRMVVQERTNYDCFTLRLRSQMEKRSVSQKTVPYRGEALDTAGRAPDPWDLPVTPPRDFEERTERVPVPHTDRVERCGGCFGAGHVRCDACQGNGKVNCPQCQGTGFRTRAAATSPGAAGADAGRAGPARAGEVREHCPGCFAGKVNCSRCNGNGRRTCPTCEGAGQVRHFQWLTVTFDTQSREEVVDEGGLPEHLVLRVKGEVLLDRRAVRIEGVGPLEPRVDERLGEVLRQSQGPPADVRLHFQHLRIEKTRAHRIGYHYGGRARELWIYGPDQRIHAPGAPWRWGLLAGLIAGAVGLVAAVIALIALL